MQLPLSDGHGSTSGIVNLTTSSLITVTGGVANTKGAWVEFIANTPYPAAGVILQHLLGIAQSSQNRSTLVDIAVGGVGAEQVLLPNVNIGFAQGSRGILFPIFVPSGSRVSLRFACTTASVIAGYQITLCNAGGNPLYYAGTRATDYGVNTAESGGTALTSSGIINTKGSWTEITASTARPMRWLIPFITPITTNSVPTQNLLVDIGVGAGGSEQALMENLAVLTSTSEECFYSPFGIPVNIPQGARLSARFQSTSIAGTAGCRVSFIGIG